ncbi:hypothetical protein [Niastella caeni]|nr:hypothetical protein [Niastella caeni]
MESVKVNAVTVAGYQIPGQKFGEPDHLQSDRNSNPGNRKPATGTW